MSTNDLVIALAGIFWLVYITCQIAACANGFGAHTAALPREFHYANEPPAHNGDVTQALSFWYLTTLLHVLSSATTRVAIGLASISRTAFPSRRRLVATNLIVSSTASALFFFLLLFQCSPISAFWSTDRSDVPAKCYTIELRTPWYTFLSISLAADAALSSFAVVSLVQRDVGRVRRGAAGVFNAFAAGHVASSAMQICHVPSLEDYKDLTWSATPFAIYSLIGPSLALIAANLTRIAPVAQQLAMANQPQVQELMPPQQRLRLSRPTSPPLIMLSGRDGEMDEDAALETVVDQGIARLERAAAVAGDGKRVRFA